MTELTFEKICSDISEMICCIPNLLDFDVNKGFATNEENVNAFKEAFIDYTKQESVKKVLENTLKPEQENLNVVFLIIAKRGHFYPEMHVFFSKYNFVIPKFYNSLISSKYVTFDIPYWCKDEENIDDIFNYFEDNDAMNEMAHLDEKYVFRVRFDNIIHS